MRHANRQPGRRPRGGFTLVEMLVSVALVVLMMLMFAEIFALASNAVSSQKGAAVNDQKVRTFTTLLNNDLKARTFRTVMPFPSMATAPPAAIDRYQRDFAAVSSDRRGYFEISENDPNDPTDDVLAFTIEIDQEGHGFSGGTATLHGKAVWRGDADDLDQPAFDDGRNDDFGAPAGLGASTMAEVAYFLRNGNLCRSVMLIREPHVKDDSAFSGPDDQPNEYPVVTNYLFDDTELQFWKDFDYSAYRDPASGRVTFHSDVSLSNAFATGTLITLPDGSNVPQSLGVPHLRWGHTLQGNGGPMEKVGTTVIGRFLKQEMASADFDYPGIGEADQSQKPGVTYDSATGLVMPFGANTLRRGEELLVPYVHEFDIQVWDDGVSPPVWTDLGGTSGGFYDASSNDNSTYGNRFDTWHPQLGDPPPFRGYRGSTASPPSTSPDGQPGLANLDDDGITPPDDAGEEGWIGTDDERPLRQIRIRVRFFDVKSGQLRQLTLTLPLTDNGDST